MPFVLIYPGTKSAPVSLQAVLKERHDNLREATAKEIERRKAKGIPLNDSVDWAAVAPLVAAQDAEGLRKMLSDGLEPLDEYEPIPGYEDIKVRFVALADKRRAELVLAVALAQNVRNAFVGQPLADVGQECIAADAVVEAAQLALIRAAVADLQMPDGQVDLGSDAVVEAIKATGTLLAHLFIAARDYQGLSPGKGSRFGSAAPSTT